jgi:membrane protein implicated in regulation of membrane protease activity
MQLVYIILFIVAAILAAGLIIGAVFKLIGFGIAALLVVIAVSWVMNKVRGPRTH